MLNVTDPFSNIGCICQIKLVPQSNVCVVRTELFGSNDWDKIWKTAVMNAILA